MNGAQYQLFLGAGTWICAIGAILNLFRLKQRGNAALILAVAFVVLGAMLMLLRANASQVLVAACGVVLVLLLIADFIVRARRQESPR